MKKIIKFNIKQFKIISTLYNIDMKIPNFIVWFKLPNGYFRIFEHETQSLETVDRLSKFEMNQFEYLTKKENRSDDDLIEYSKQIILDRNQLITSKYLTKPFDYFDNTLICSHQIYYRNHSNNVKTFIKKFKIISPTIVLSFLPKC